VITSKWEGQKIEIMGVLRLGICIGGVYATFLLWAIAQERCKSQSLQSSRCKYKRAQGRQVGA